MDRTKSMQAYLWHHGIERLFSHMLNEVLVSKPDDPIDFFITHLRQEFPKNESDLNNNQMAEQKTSVDDGRETMLQFIRTALVDGAKQLIALCTRVSLSPAKKMLPSLPSSSSPSSPIPPSSPNAAAQTQRQTTGSLASPSAGQCATAVVSKTSTVLTTVSEASSVDNDTEMLRQGAAVTTAIAALRNLVSPRLCDGTAQSDTSDNDYQKSFNYFHSKNDRGKKSNRLEVQSALSSSCMMFNALSLDDDHNSNDDNDDTGSTKNIEEYCNEGSSLLRAVGITPMSEWYLHSFPKLAAARLGINYHPYQQREVLLKAAVAAEHLAAAAAEGPNRHSSSDYASSFSLDSFGVLVQQWQREQAELNRRMREEETDGNESLLRTMVSPSYLSACVFDAWFTLFLYTVDIRGYHNIDDVNTTLVHVRASWQKQCGISPTWKKDPELYYEIPKADLQPPDPKAFGYNVAIWALTNWSNRVSRDPTQPRRTRDKARDAAEVTNIFSSRLQAILLGLPMTHATVFRGMKGYTTSRYFAGQLITWHAFSSTSTEDKAALAFMGKDKGTFFTIHCHTARNISWASWFPLQAEKLLPMNTQFEVQTRCSDTLLTMVESPAELISMKEVGRGATLTPEEAADVAVLAACNSVFIFDGFLSRYVPGVLSVKRNSRVGSISVEAFAKKLEEECFRHDQFRYIIVGSGGTGKTSAMLYLLGFLSRRCAERLKRKPSSFTDSHSAKPLQIFPVFVPLPAVSEISQKGAIDLYIQRLLGVNAVAMQSLAQRHHLVVLLDSLDEVDFDGHSPEAVTCELMARNPLLATLPKWILLSTREETRVAAEELLTPTIGTSLASTHDQFPVRIYHCLPFDDADKCRYITSVEPQMDTDKEQKIKREDETMNMFDPSRSYLSEKIKKGGLWDLVGTPFLLYIVCETLKWNAEAFSHLRDLRQDFERNVLTDSSFLANQLDARENQTNDPESGSWTLEPLVATSEMYAAYFESWAESMMSSKQLEHPIDLVATAERVAVALTSAETSSARVGDLGRFSLRKLIGLLRVESVEDTQSHVAFRHKSLQDFLVARALFEESMQCLERRYFTLGQNSLFNTIGKLGKRFPSVIRLMVDRLKMLSVPVFKKLCQAWVGSLLILKRKHPHNLQSVENIFSNILSLLSAGRIVIRTLVPAAFTKADVTDLFKGMTIVGADLTGCFFSGLNLTNTTIVDCTMHGVDFTCCNFENLALVGTDIGVLPSFQGPTMPVFSVKFSPDGHFVVLGSLDGNVRIFSVDTFSLLHTIAIGNEVRAVCFRNRGKELVVGGKMGCLQVYDWESRKMIYSANTLEGESLLSVSVCKDGEGKIVAGLESGDVIVFTGPGAKMDSSTKLSRAKDEADSESPPFPLQLIHRWKMSKKRINCVKVSSTNTMIAVGGADGTATILDLSSGAIKHVFRLSDGVYGADFSPDDQLLGVCTWDRQISLFSVVSRTLVLQFVGHAFGLSSVRFSPDGNHLLSGGWDDCAKQFSVETGAEIRTFTGHGGGVRCIDVSTDGAWLVTGSLDCTAKIYSLGAAREEEVFPGHLGWSNSANFSPDGKYIVSSSVDKSLRIWLAETGVSVRCFHRNSETACAVFHPNAASILVGYAKPLSDNRDSEEDFKGTKSASELLQSSIQLIDVHSGAVLSNVPCACQNVFKVAFSTNGKWFASAGTDTGVVRIFSATPEADEKEIVTLQDHKMGCLSVFFSNDGTLLGSTAKDTTVKIYSLQQKEESSSVSEKEAAKSANSNEQQQRLQCTLRFSLNFHTDEVFHGAFSPDNSKVATASQDGTLRCASIHQQQSELKELFVVQAKAGIGCVCFSPCGRWIAAGAKDTQVRFVDVVTGGVFFCLNIFSGWVNSVAFSPCGKRFVTSCHGVTAIDLTNLPRIFELWQQGTTAEETSEIVIQTKVPLWRSLRHPFLTAKGGVQNAATVKDNNLRLILEQQSTNF